MADGCGPGCGYCGRCTLGYERDADEQDDDFDSEAAFIDDRDDDFGFNEQEPE
jgi:hypothetical protein